MDSKLKKWRDSADHSKPVIISNRVSRIPKFQDNQQVQQADELNKKLKKWQISAEEGKRVFSSIDNPRLSTFSSTPSVTKQFAQIPRSSTNPTSELDKKLKKWQQSVDQSKPVFSGVDQKVPKISKSWLEYKQKQSVRKRVKSKSESELEEDANNPREHYWTRVLKKYFLIHSGPESLKSPGKKLVK